MHYDSTENIAREISKATEASIMAQLNDFISRGLIIVEHGPMSFTRNPLKDPYKINIEQTVSLKLKDKEYIEKLEAENKRYKDLLASLNAEVTGTYETSKN